MELSRALQWSSSKPNGGSFTSSLGLEGRSRALFWFLANPGNHVFLVFGYTGNHPQSFLPPMILYWYHTIKKLIN
jgi:hypothetical protein